MPAEPILLDADPRADRGRLRVEGEDQVAHRDRRHGERGVDALLLGVDVLHDPGELLDVRHGRRGQADVGSRSCKSLAEVEEQVMNYQEVYLEVSGA